MILEPDRVLMRHVVMATLAAAAIGAAITTVLHRWDVQPHWMNLIAPPALSTSCLGLLVYLDRQPHQLQRVIRWGLISGILCVVLPSWVFTIEAFCSPNVTLVGTLPPITSALFLLTMLMLIALRPQNLLRWSIASWVAIAAPILSYLLSHPSELISARGLDLLISLGPAMAVQIMLIFSYGKLQRMVSCLYAARFHYYDQIIERQTIRQDAIEQVFHQIHNGPLQSLTLLMREMQQEAIPTTQLMQRLGALNTEIRAIGQNLSDRACFDRAFDQPASPSAPLEPTMADHWFRLGEGSLIDLDRPLHYLLYEVYSLTLKRSLPHFKTIRVKVRNFGPCEPEQLTLELKRDICLWLEEALCNVGKHAQAATRILVIGECQGDRYHLKVQDNGPGMTSSKIRQGTQQAQRLADRLQGEFRRMNLPEAGYCCELAWPLERSPSLNPDPVRSRP